MADAPDLDLATLIAAIRTDLERAEAARRQASVPPLFRMSEMELELNFVVTRTTTGKGGIDFKVLSLGGEREVAREQVQKISLKFAVDPEALKAGVLGSRFSGEGKAAKEATDVPPMQ